MIIMIKVTLLFVTFGFRTFGTILVSGVTFFQIFSDWLQVFVSGLCGIYITLVVFVLEWTISPHFADILVFKVDVNRYITFLEFQCNQILDDWACEGVLGLQIHLELRILLK